MYMYMYYMYMYMYMYMYAYIEGMPACRATARLHTLSEADVGLASPSGDQAGQRHSEQS